MAREQTYNEEINDLKEAIKSCGQTLLLHGDGKKVDENGTTVERFPILLSGFPDGKTRILWIPAIPDTTGQTMADEVFKVISTRCNYHRQVIDAF